MANIPVQNPSGWLSILTRLGITGIARWFLSDTVVPVALVDSSITLNASSSTPLVNVPASNGVVVAPAANARLATTGALPAGPYSMTFWLSTNAVPGNNFRVRRRNSADTADIWSFQFFAQSSDAVVVLSLRLLLAINELVIVDVVGADAGNNYQASIFVNAG